MPGSESIAATWSHGRATASANTVINVLVPPRNNKKTKLDKYVVTTGATAHTLTILRPLNRVKLALAAAASQAVIVLAADPGIYLGKVVANNLITTNDWLVLQLPDGTYSIVRVHSSTAPVTNADGTVNVTLTANLGVLGAKQFALCWFMGIITDTDPQTGEAHPIFTLKASGTNSDTGNGGSLCESLRQFDPLILQIDNATNASTLENASGLYGP